MKNKIIIILIAAASQLQSQTPRLSVYELFTGETCPPTAQYNPALNLLLAQPANEAKMVTINWEVPIPTVPTPTWSLYKTNKAEIDWRYRSLSGGGYGYQTQQSATGTIAQGIQQSPYGLIDGQQPWVFGAINPHPMNMNSAVISTAQSYTSAFSVTMNKSWDASFSNITLTITIVASANFTATGALVFRTVMTERNVNFAIAPGTTGEKHFEHVAIRSFPSIQSGVPMSGTWTTGQTQTFTLACPLPSYVRDKTEVGFVGFIQDDGNRKIAQGVMSVPEPFGNDAKSLSILSSNGDCESTAYSPTLMVRNSGTNTITNFTITPKMNGITLPDEYWTGSLLSGDTAKIALGSYSGAPLTTGQNTFMTTLTGVSGGDNNAVNNTSSKNVNIPFLIYTLSATPSVICAGESSTLNIIGKDDYYWTDFGIRQTLVAKPASSTIYTINIVSLSTTCFKTVTISLMVDECTSLPKYSDNKRLQLYPNPMTDKLFLHADGPLSEKNYLITDNLGRQILHGKIENNITVLDVSCLSTGIYFLHVEDMSVKLVK